MSVKTCKKCGVKKPLKDFRKRPDTIDGRYGQCRDCCRAYAREYSRAYYRKNHDAVRASQKAHYDKKKETNETTPASHCPHTPRHQPTQAVNEVAINMPHEIPLAEAHKHLKTIEGMLHALYQFTPAQGTTRKKIKDIAGQVNAAAVDIDRYERRTRLVHPDHKH